MPWSDHLLYVSTAHASHIARHEPDGGTRVLPTKDDDLDWRRIDSSWTSDFGIEPNEQVDCAKTQEGHQILAPLRTLAYLPPSSKDYQKVNFRRNFDSKFHPVFDHFQNRIE